MIINRNQWQFNYFTPHSKRLLVCPPHVHTPLWRLLLSLLVEESSFSSEQRKAWFFLPWLNFIVVVPVRCYFIHTYLAQGREADAFVSVSFLPLDTGLNEPFAVKQLPAPTPQLLMSRFVVWSHSALRLTTPTRDTLCFNTCYCYCWRLCWTEMKFFLAILPSKIDTCFHPFHLNTRIVF